MKNWIKDPLRIFQNSTSENISYPSEGNKTCFSIEDNSQWFDQRNELILAFINKHGVEGDFLDIGGGNGYQAKAIIESGFKGKVILCEPGYQGCVNARNRGVEWVFNGMFQDIQFDEFDIKGCGLFDVIEHIEDDLKFLNQLYDKLEPGSKVFINVPAMKILWSETDEFAGHFRRYDLHDINRIESNTSFKVIDYGYYFSFYFLPLWLLRVIPYKLGLRNGNEAVLISEIRNLQSKKGFLDNLMKFLHKKALNKVKTNNYSTFGTSLFIVLKKQ